VAGVEESHGVLTSPTMRDKDAAGGAVALAALADREKARGRTLVDVLHDLQTAHGTVRNTQVSVRFEGATGASEMAALLDRLREAPPSVLGGRNVVSFTDHLSPAGRLGPHCSESDAASRNVLVFHLEAGDGDEGARIILRPSGTEPKVKLYVELQGRRGLDVDEQPSVDAAASALANAVKATFLG
jgi:phosphomannomutase